MIKLRPFRNSDPPALAGLWNRGTPQSLVARPLTGHEFDAQVVGMTYFDREGLILAEASDKLLGFVHAGFGPNSADSTPQVLDYPHGTIAMLVVDPLLKNPLVEDQLISAAQAYLQERGAKVIYAGGQSPLSPYYRSIYGGSEWSGILGSDRPFRAAITRAGFEEVSETVLLELNLDLPEKREPRNLLVRRQVNVEVIEDVTLPAWWDDLALGDFRPTQFRLLSRADHVQLAVARTWDMSWFGRIDGRARLGVFDLDVSPEHRRKGYGRFLLSEIARQAREQNYQLLEVQTRVTNAPALALYQALGFEPIESATLFRRPGPT